MKRLLELMESLFNELWVVQQGKATWENIVDTYNDDDEIFLPVFVAWLLFFITYWVYGLALLFFERKHFPLAFDKKLQPTRPMQFSKTSYNPGFLELVQNVLFNWVFVILPTLFVLQKFLRPYGFGIHVSKEFPSIIQVIFHAVAAPYLVDFTFYHSHYLLHQPWFYQHIHKKHHEFKAPYGLASIYAHWFEALVGNTIAIMGLGFILRLHVLEWYIAGMLGWIGTNTAHSGLHLPYTHHEFPKLRNNFGNFGFTDFHDYHHKYFVGNYGHGIFCDAMYGTDLKWRELCTEVDRKMTQT